MLVRGNSSIDEPEGEKGNSCSLNSPLNRGCVCEMVWRVKHVYVALQLEVTA